MESSLSSSSSSSAPARTSSRLARPVTSPSTISLTERMARHSPRVSSVANDRFKLCTILPSSLKVHFLPVFPCGILTPQCFKSCRILVIAYFRILNTSINAEVQIWWLINVFFHFVGHWLEFNNCLVGRGGGIKLEMIELLPPVGPWTG